MVKGAATPTLTTGYIKNKFKPRGLKMNFVTYNNIRLKCYINLFKSCYIVPAEKECPQMLARAINIFKKVIIKK